MVTLLSTSRVQTPGLTMSLIGGGRILVTDVPLKEPRKGEKNWKSFKTPENYLENFEVNTIKTDVKETKVISLLHRKTLYERNL